MSAARDLRDMLIVLAVCIGLGMALGGVWSTAAVSH